MIAGQKPEGIAGGATNMAAMVRRVLLASPRGYCAGVERAVETVELALEHYGRPIYVRKQIVHNATSSATSRRAGAIFVDSEEEAPEGSTIVFSAHGVAPAVHERAAARSLNTIDATCPLVTKVHVQARRYADAGYTILLIGHAGHEEVEGTMGEAPDSTVLVESVEDAERLDLPADAKVAYITQTTLPSTRRPRSSASSAGASRTSTRRRKRTSATQPPTASGR
jgi:4-hydroxy-3-methylbut-2-enyl diphosphate reductase